MKLTRQERETTLARLTTHLITGDYFDTTENVWKPFSIRMTLPKFVEHFKSKGTKLRNVSFAEPCCHGWSIWFGNP